MTTEDTDVFFGSGIIAADFRQDGMVAVDRDMLKIFVKTAESWSAHSLSALPVTPCGPAAFLGLTALSTLLTLCSCTVNVCMSVGDGCGRCDRLSRSHLEAGKKAVEFLCQRGISIRDIVSVTFVVCEVLRKDRVPDRIDFRAATESESLRGLVLLDHTFYDTMAHNDKELNELLRKGRAVAASLGKVYDRTQMEAAVKEGHADPAKMDLDQTIKQGQTVIKNLDNASSRNNLDHLLKKESIELFGQPNQNGPKAKKKKRTQSSGKIREKSRPKQAKHFSSHDSRVKSRPCLKPTEFHHDQGPDHDSLLSELQDLLSAASSNLHSESTPHSASLHWGTRTAASSERWREARPSLIINRLITEHCKVQLCSECKAKVAVVKCKDCLPHQYTCIDCDSAIHSKQVFHNRSSMISGFHKAVPPTTVVKQDSDGQYFHHHEDRLLPMALPNSICSCGEKYSVGIGKSITVINMKASKFQLQRQSGTLWGDTFLKSFFEWSICRYEVDKICGEQHFMCPACTPLMLAIAVDGNRKLHRFKKAGNSEGSGYFEGLFLCKDDDVSSFVQYIRKKVQHVGGKGVCGSAELAAAKEFSSKTSSKLDEEGIEVAVCRHGVLLRALNMFRGEIYAYPLYLQKELCTENATFFCADIMCKYWPYLIKVCQACPELRHLLNMKPFLSVMHAKVHGVKCEIKWSGSFQTGAAYTMGEEVEQANSFLSRIGISTKFMSKAG
ncbi:uncharacterized protein LOC107719253 [Sinocyclocheilus rhinocerous]|uniref:uncharacterized protein LOC107719253 n=1 Tax=Sinocyclocheilus rhinocerous TaxID=307959 RepID=UPI0007B796CB|nr:PREDICTED: uncharacterized protein LOC107719253 [Sinocyclocheilus rhinocerous]